MDRNVKPNREIIAGTAQWVREGSEHQTMLLAEGYEPTLMRHFVMDWFWSVLMVRCINQYEDGS